MCLDTCALAPSGLLACAMRLFLNRVSFWVADGGRGMKTWMVVFVIGIATMAFGCAAQELHEQQSLRVRVASYSSPVSAQSSWYGAITVSPEQVFED
jgi:hypothetical protein